MYTIAVGMESLALNTPKMPLFNYYRCGNIHNSEPTGKSCLKKAIVPCKRCGLISYCSSKCLQSHRKKHEEETCNSPLSQANWKPIWETQSSSDSASAVDNGPKMNLWGQIPAINLLKGYKQWKQQDSINICLAASGDLRNVVSTLAEIQPSQQTDLRITINDPNPFVAIRNVATLLLLCTLPAGKAAELAIHLWYSAALTKLQHTIIVSTLEKLLSQVSYQDSAPKEDVHYTFELGKTNLSVSFPGETWALFSRMLKATIEQNEAARNRNKVMFGYTAIENFHRFLCHLEGYERVSAMAFRETGILLPYALCVGKEFSAPNPFFFHPDTKEWMLNDSQSPEAGWDIRELSKVRTAKCIPKNDLFGSLYFYLHGQLTETCNRLRGRRVQLLVTCVDPQELPKRFASFWRKIEFDVIDVSNLADEQFLGIKQVHSIFGPLLRKSNPDSTLLTIFIDVIRADAASGSNENLLSAAKEILQVIPGSLETKSGGRLYPGRLHAVSQRLTDHPAEFAGYMDNLGFNTSAEVSGLKARSVGTIMERWPYRLGANTNRDHMRRRLHFLDMSRLSGGECFVEWVNARSEQNPVTTQCSKGKGSNRSSAAGTRQPTKKDIIESFRQWDTITTQDLLHQGVLLEDIIWWQNVRKDSYYQDILSELVLRFTQILKPPSEFPPGSRTSPLPPRISKGFWSVVLDNLKFDKRTNSAIKDLIAIGLIAWTINNRPDILAGIGRM